MKMPSFPTSCNALAFVNNMFSVEQKIIVVIFAVLEFWISCPNNV